MKNKCFGICYNPEISGALEAGLSIKNKLLDYRIEAQVFNIDELSAGFDFVFVIGGDGTILKAARFYAKNKTPKNCSERFCY